MLQKLLDLHVSRQRRLEAFTRTVNGLGSPLALKNMAHTVLFVKAETEKTKMRYILCMDLESEDILKGYVSKVVHNKNIFFQCGVHFFN